MLKWKGFVIVANCHNPTTRRYVVHSFDCSTILRSIHQIGNYSECLHKSIIWLARTSWIIHDHLLIPSNEPMFDSPLITRLDHNENERTLQACHILSLKLISMFFSFCEACRYDLPVQVIYICRCRCMLTCPHGSSLVRCSHQEPSRNIWWHSIDCEIDEIRRWPSVANNVKCQWLSLVEPKTTYGWGSCNKITPKKEHNKSKYQSNEWLRNVQTKRIHIYTLLLFSSLHSQCELNME